MVNKFTQCLVMAILVTNCACGQLTPTPDCFTVGDVVFGGIVRDEQLHPIPYAELEIKSMNETSCSNYPPTDLVLITANEDGTFYHSFPFLSEDNTLQVSIRAEGYEPFTYNYASYVSFSGDMEFVLSDKD